jgi:hypothetical protein
MTPLETAMQAVMMTFGLGYCVGLAFVVILLFARRAGGGE